MEDVRHAGEKVVTRQSRATAIDSAPVGARKNVNTVHKNFTIQYR